MKIKIFRKYNVILLLIIFFIGTTEARDQELSRTVSKNYKVQKSTRLDIHNSFGKVHVNNWEKSEFGIQIEIIAEASNDDKARRILDKIEIEISESTTEISFVTQLNRINNKNNEDFEVNYTVYMPAFNPLKVKNSFGDVYLDNRIGESEIEVAYGALKASDFTGKLDLQVSFGSADFNRAEEAEIEIKYSDTEIGYVERVELETGFSDVEFGTIRSGDIESKYGSLELEEAGDIEVDIQYSDFEIELLTGSLIMDAQYVSGFRVEKVDPGFSLIDIDGEFGSYELRIPGELAAQFEGEFDFCDLNVRGVSMDFTFRVKESNESYYKGTIGGGNADKRIKIESRYGDCTLRSY